MEGGKDWSREIHEISKDGKSRGGTERSKNNIKKGLRVEKTSLFTEKHVATNNSSPLFLVN